MAVLSYDLSQLDLAEKRKYKKIFEKLDDKHIIRTPALENNHIAPIVVEGPKQSWLCIGIHATSPDNKELSRFLAFNKKLKDLGFVPLAYLAICQTRESLFHKKDASLNDVIIIQQDKFYAKGEKYINHALRQMDDNAHCWIKQNLAFESFINSILTVKKTKTIRNNCAQLDNFFLDYNQEQAVKFDIWRDPSSESLAEDFSVRLINGVAGCGKTLILINRALLYCKKYPDKNALLLIHNKPITESIRHKIEQHLGGIPKNLEIMTFHQYAHKQQRKRSRFVKALMYEKDKKPFIDKILSTDNDAYAKLNLSDQQIWSEIEYINDFLIANQESYLHYDRQGRGFALSQAQRKAIWQLYELHTQTMSSPQQGYLPSLYIRELCLNNQLSLNNQEAAIDTYDHIMIDEAQFFFPSWLELVKKSIKENGKLFLCADPNQGFLKSRLSWKNVAGINVRGRTKKLTYSYRTTYEIMLAANALLKHLNEDSEDFIQPELDKMERGSKPYLIYSDTAQDEQKRFLSEIKLCVNNENLPLEHIMVLCSEAISPEKVKKMIIAQTGTERVVNCNKSDGLRTYLADSIKVMTINSCTGMEAGIVFVLGIGQLLDKMNNLDLNQDEAAIIQQESIRKLYVAMTRAGQKLVLFSTHRFPEEVEALMSLSGHSSQLDIVRSS